MAEFFQTFGAALPYKIGLIAILSSFMIVTARAFVRDRVLRKQAEYAEIIRFLGVREDQSRLATRAVIEEYPAKAYVVPVATATLVTVFGLASLFFAAELVELDPRQRNVILSALFGGPDAISNEWLRWQSMVVLTLAFLGAYIWSGHNIIRRLIAGDLAPVEYFNTTLRMILAPLLSLMVSFLLHAAGSPRFLMQALPVIAFMTGMLPGAMLVWLEDKVRQMLRFASNGAPDLPLAMIEGLNRFHEVRLGEAGIDNAQNLAEANLVELILKTPFNPNQLIDWIAQARLYVYVKDDLIELRRYGIRSAFDLAALADDAAQIEAIAKLASVSDLALATIARRLHHDPVIDRLAQFRLRLSPDLQLGGGAGAHSETPGMKPPVRAV